jgi:predicted RNA-binding protein with PUA-like domain
MSTYDYLIKKYGLTLSWKQASEELDIYWEKVRNLCAQGVIKTPKAGRKWVLTTKSIAEYIDRGAHETR